MYFPAVRLSLSVDTTQAGPIPLLELILLIAYLDVSPRRLRMLSVSSGEDMVTLLCPMTSWISTSNPFLALASTTSPVVVNGSRKILLRGREYAEGSVLSAMKNRRGSDPLSSKDISAEPGPAPLTLPENASVRMSCPAA